MRRLRPTIGLLALTLIASLLPAGAVSADDPAPSITTLTAPASVEEGSDVVLTATVSAPDGYETDATITFAPVLSGGTSCDAVAVSTSGTECDLAGLPVGTYTYEATYTGDAAVAGSTSEPVTFDVTTAPPPPAASTTSLLGPGSIVVGDPAVLTATVSAPDGYDSDATITFSAISGGGPDCTDVAVSTSGTECDLTSLPIGTYVYSATYSGNTATLGSTSAQVTFEVTAVPDTTLDASGVTVDLATFYPVKDGYKDGLTLSGLRNEPITVTIRIYGPTGSRVLLTTLPLADGAYSYGWTGRDAHGRVRAAGRYKITQTLADLAGNTLVVTKYATLSQKRLITRTKYVSKLGRSITAGSSGNIIVSTRIGYAKLRGTSGNPAMAGYAFTIPSATVYRSITFQVYATGPSAAPRSTIGLQNMSWCPDLSGDWDIGCFDRWVSWSGSASAWHSAKGSPSLDRKATKVRGAIYASHGTVTVRKVRLKVVYQVLG